MASRDARRFVVGFVVAVVAWFVILYPNISALPLPSAVVAAYQGILPTYLYAFQFPVSTVDPERRTRHSSRRPWRSCCSPSTVTCLVVAYSAWVWRLTLAERLAAPERPVLRLVRGQREPRPDRRRLRHRRAEVRRAAGRSRPAGG